MSVWSFAKVASGSLILLTSVVPSRVAAQTPDEYHVVQAVVDSLRSPGQCAQIDLYLRAQPDVIVARMDYNTRNVMLQVHAFSAIDAAWLRDRFASLGLHMRCFLRRPLQSAVYKPLDPRTCIDALPSDAITH
jgi:hypothetical protein